MSQCERLPVGRRCRGLQRLAFLLIAAGVAASTSCDDPAVPSTPASSAGVGVLRGYVRIDGEPAAVAIGASEFNNGRIVAQTRSNASGWYQLALPSGAYSVELIPPNESYFYSDARDTVRVGRGVRYLDVHRVTLKIQVLLPMAFDGDRFYCELDPRPPFVGRASAQAHKGRLDFEFSAVPPGGYRIHLSSGDTRFWLPGTIDDDAADIVTVRATHATRYRATVTNHAVITGTVRGSWQEMGAPSPYVRAYTLSGDVLDGTSTTRDGAFTLNVIDVQPVRLRVSISDIDQWIGGNTLESATTFRPQKGQRLDDVSFVEGGIYCQLEGPLDLENYRASALLRERSGRTYEIGYTDRESIRICNLPSGSYQLYVHGHCLFDPQPWASQWYDRAESMAAATFIDVNVGRATHVTMRLESDGRIEGRILDSLGQPVRAPVAVYQSGASLCGYSRLVTSFSFRGLADGDYTLAAHMGSSSEWWYPGTLDPDSAGVLQIRNHGTLSGIEWRLPPIDAEAKP